MVNQSIGINTDIYITNEKNMLLKLFVVNKILLEKACRKSEIEKKDNDDNNSNITPCEKNNHSELLGFMRHWEKSYCKNVTSKQTKMNCIFYFYEYIFRDNNSNNVLIYTQ